MNLISFGDCSRSRKGSKSGRLVQVDPIVHKNARVVGFEGPQLDRSRLA